MGAARRRARRYVSGMPKALLTALLGLLAVFATASASQAQIQAIPGSGCPGMPNPSFTGQARLGNSVTCSCPPSIDRMRVLIGTRAPRSAATQAIDRPKMPPPKTVKSAIAKPVPPAHSAP